MPSKRDYYEVLNVSREATSDELRKAYRREALKHHPDRNPGDASAEAKFKEMNEAYQVLSDDEKRRIYDQFGHAGLDGARGRRAATASATSSRTCRTSSPRCFRVESASAGTRRPRRGGDLRVQARLSLREAAFGCKREVQRPRSGRLHRLRRQRRQGRDASRSRAPSAAARGRCRTRAASSCSRRRVRAAVVPAGSSSTRAPPARATVRSSARARSTSRFPRGSTRGSGCASRVRECRAQAERRLAISTSRSTSRSDARLRARRSGPGHARARSLHGRGARRGDSSARPRAGRRGRDACRS